MTRLEPFDPITVERAMVQHGLLPQMHPDQSGGQLGDLEGRFTEFDQRKSALWRITTVRQFQPEVLRGLADEDLLFIAGQSAEGYTQSDLEVVVLHRNKVTQNAERARIELDRRATHGTWKRNAAVAIASALLGASLSLVAAALNDDGGRAIGGSSMPAERE